MQRGCRRAHSREGASAVLAILAVLAALRAAPGGSARRPTAPFPSVPRDDLPVGMVGTKEWPLPDQTKEWP